jgi:L-ascorbate metabolism protein UlaG (beta-lactamase superfamily)
MDLQYFGGNCVVVAGKGIRVVVDDTLAELGLKSVAKQGDILLYTGRHKAPVVQPRLAVDGPGEYEVSGVSVLGIAARGHMDEPGTHDATVYRVIAEDATYLFVGHIYPELNDEQLEAIGMVDVMFVPVGGNGYTLDATGALQLIKAIEPKLVIPTHYADSSLHYPVEQQPLEQVLKNLAMEPTETISKLRFKPIEQSATTQLVILTRN